MLVTPTPDLGKVLNAMQVGVMLGRPAQGAKCRWGVAQCVMYDRCPHKYQAFNNEGHANRVFCMQEMKIEGEVNLATAVQIAQLALKHRQNKNQRQRVVIFIGSPIAEDKVRRWWAEVLLHRLSFRGGADVGGCVELEVCGWPASPRAPSLTLPVLPRSACPAFCAGLAGEDRQEA